VDIDLWAAPIPEGAQIVEAYLRPAFENTIAPLVDIPVLTCTKVYLPIIERCAPKCLQPSPY